jgi:hypothetical protein
MKKMKVVEKLQICKYWFCTLLVPHSSRGAMEYMDLARIGSKFPRGPKLKLFTVPITQKQGWK